MEQIELTRSGKTLRYKLKNRRIFIEKQDDFVLVRTRIIIGRENITKYDAVIDAPFGKKIGEKYLKFTIDAFECFAHACGMFESVNRLYESENNDKTK